MRNHQDAKMIDEERLEHDQRNEVKIVDVYDEQKEEFIEMFLNFDLMLNWHLDQTNIAKFETDLSPANPKPIYSAPYRPGPKARKFNKNGIEKMFLEGVFEPSQTERAAPIVFVPKKDGLLRSCVDYPKFIAVTKQDTYCTSQNEFYRFVRMPFRLRNAPSTFQRTMGVALSAVQWKLALVYVWKFALVNLDKIVFFSRSAAKHIDHVKDVLTLLRNAAATLKLKKCTFFTETIY